MNHETEPKRYGDTDLPLRTVVEEFVTFGMMYVGGPSYPSVTISRQQWIDLGRPLNINVRIEPIPEVPGV